MAAVQNVLAIDVGATKIQWAVIKNGKIIEKEKMKTLEKMDNKKLANLVIAIASKTKPNRAGISLPGFVKNGKILQLPNLPNVKNMEIEKELKRKLKIPVFAQNDVKCMAIALLNEKNACNSFIVVAPGSGIGGAIVIDGKIVLGKQNCAGEFGHMKIIFEGKGRGTKIFEWEQICGGKGIEKKYFEKTRKRKSAKEIFSSHKKIEKNICKNAAYYFGIGLANIANALNPQKIIITGSVGKAYLAKYKKTVLDAFEKNAIEPVRKTKIEKCRMENPALAGAAML